MMICICPWTSLKTSISGILDHPTWPALMQQMTWLVHGHHWEHVRYYALDHRTSRIDAKMTWFFHGHHWKHVRYYALDHPRSHVPSQKVMAILHDRHPKHARYDEMDSPIITCTISKDGDYRLKDVIKQKRNHALCHPTSHVLFKDMHPTSHSKTCILSYYSKTWYHLFAYVIKINICSRAHVCKRWCHSLMHLIESRIHIMTCRISQHMYYCKRWCICSCMSSKKRPRLYVVLHHAMWFVYGRHRKLVRNYASYHLASHVRPWKLVQYFEGIHPFESEKNREKHIIHTTFLMIP